MLRVRLASAACPACQYKPQCRTRRKSLVGIGEIVRAGDSVVMLACLFGGRSRRLAGSCCGRLGDPLPSKVMGLPACTAGCDAPGRARPVAPWRLRPSCMSRQSATRPGRVHRRSRSRSRRRKMRPDAIWKSDPLGKSGLPGKSRYRFRRLG